MSESAELPERAEAAAPLLRIEAVQKRFGGAVAVDGLSLDIRAGEFFALLGPSGCGKTTLLRMLAGFESPDAGRILLDGEDIAAVPPHRRPVNMMFQNYALFPHLSVQHNIAFGLKRAGLRRAAVAERVAEMVALVRLDGLERRRPDQLSGGQQQRVALARALALRPKLLLLDEPMAALDRKLREATQLELQALQRRLGTTFIIVTHDQHEAMALADRIGVMNHGRLEQVAAPRQLYEAPVSRWVAEFVGDTNIFAGEVAGRDDGRILVATADAGTIAATEPLRGVSAAAVCVAVRPEKLRLSRRGPLRDIVNPTALTQLDATVTEVSYLGGVSTYHLTTAGGAALRAAIANTARLEFDEYRVGERVVAWFAPDDGVVLER